MANTVSIQTFTFAELDEKVQKRIIQKFIEDEAHDYFDINNNIKETFKETIKDKGYPTDDIRFSLNSCQGDGVALYTKEFDCIEILKRINAISEEECKQFTDITAKITQRGCNYNHYNSMVVSCEMPMLEGMTEVEWTEILDKYEKAIKQDLKDLSQTLEEKGYNIIESSTSEELVKETLLEFDTLYLKDGTEFKDSWL